MISTVLTLPASLRAQESRAPDYIARERLYRQLPLNEGRWAHYRHEARWSDTEGNQPILSKRWETEQEVLDTIWTGSAWLFVVDVTVTNQEIDTNPLAINRVDTALSVFEPARDHLLVYRLEGRFLHRFRTDQANYEESKDQLMEQFSSVPGDSAPWFVLPPYPEDCNPRSGPDREECLLRSAGGDTPSWKIWYLGARSSKNPPERSHIFGLKKDGIRILREFSMNRGLVLDRRQGRWDETVQLVQSRDTAPDTQAKDQSSNAPKQPTAPKLPGAPSAPNQPNMPTSPSRINPPNQPNQPNRME